MSKIKPKLWFNTGKKRVIAFILAFAMCAATWAGFSLRVQAAATYSPRNDTVNRQAYLIGTFTNGNVVVSDSTGTTPSPVRALVPVNSAKTGDDGGSWVGIKMDCVSSEWGYFRVTLSLPAGAYSFKMFEQDTEYQRSELFSTGLKGYIYNNDGYRYNNSDETWNAATIDFSLSTTKDVTFYFVDGKRLNFVEWLPSPPHSGRSDDYMRWVCSTETRGNLQPFWYDITQVMESGTIGASQITTDEGNVAKRIIRGDYFMVRRTDAGSYGTDGGSGWQITEQRYLDSTGNFYATASNDPKAAVRGPNDSTYTSTAMIYDYSNKPKNTADWNNVIFNHTQTVNVAGVYSYYMDNVLLGDSTKGTTLNTTDKYIKGPMQHLEAVYFPTCTITNLSGNTYGESSPVTISGNSYGFNTANPTTNNTVTFKVAGTVATAATTPTGWNRDTTTTISRVYTVNTDASGNWTQSLGTLPAGVYTVDSAIAVKSTNPLVTTARNYSTNYTRVNIVPNNESINSASIATVISTENGKGSRQAALNNSMSIGSADGVTTSTSRTVSTTFSVTAANVAITKTASPDGGKAVKAGDTITYTLQVANTGTGAANNVVISDAIPEGTTLKTINNSGTQVDDVIWWNVGTLAATGGTATVSFTVTVDDSATTVDNTAYVYIDPPGFNISTPGTLPATSSGTASQTIKHPVVEVVKTSQTDPVGLSSLMVGDKINYTITVTNKGSVAADGVVITDTIPANTTLVGSFSPAQTSDSSGVYRWELGTISVGASNTISFTVEVANTAGDGDTIQNTAKVYTPADPNPKDVSDDPHVVRDPCLEISKEADITGAVRVGSYITYTITVENRSTAKAATDVVITDIIPNGTTFVSIGEYESGDNIDGTVYWLIEEIEAEGEIAVHLKVRVDESALAIGTIENTAKVFKDVEDFDIDDGETYPEPADGDESNTVKHPVVVAEKAADVAFAKAGDEITYTITVTNLGDIAADGITVTDTVPAGTTLVADSIDNGGVLTGTGDAGDLITWAVNLTDTTPGNVKTLSFTVTVGDFETEGTIANTATLLLPGDGSGPDQNPPGDIDSDPVITGMIDLSAVKTSDPETGEYVTVGDVITYKITITNSGSAEAKGVKVLDTIPAGTTLKSDTISENGVLEADGTGKAGELITWTIDVPGAAEGKDGEATVSFSVVVDDYLAGITNITNSAVFYPPGADTEKDDPEVVNDEPENPIAMPNIFTEKTASYEDGAVVEIGDTIEYTITIENNSTDTMAKDFYLIDPVPEGTAVNADSIDNSGYVDEDGNVVWYFEGIAENGEVTVHYSVTVIGVDKDDEPVDEVRNVAYYTYKGATLPTDEDSPGTKVPDEPWQIVNHPDFTVVKTVDVHSGTPVKSGEILTYTITLTNNALSAVTGIKITDTVPVNTTLVEDSISHDGVIDEDGLITWEIEAVTDDAAVELSFKVTVNAGLADGTKIRNTAYMSSPVVNPEDPESEPAYSEPEKITGEPENPVYVESLTMLKVLANPDVATVSRGDNVTYNITVKNNSGVKAATGVVITDPVPANTEFVSATQGGALVGGEVKWTIASIAPGATVTLSVTVKVKSDAANRTVIKNTAYYTPNKANPADPAPAPVKIPGEPEVTVVVAPPSPPPPGGDPDPSPSVQPPYVPAPIVPNPSASASSEPSPGPSDNPPEQSGAPAESIAPAEPTTPAEPNTPDTAEQGVVYTPVSQNPADQPPAPTVVGHDLIPNDDGTYTEFDLDGTPLGTWRFDEELGEWVFDPLPLGDGKINPKTGGSENSAIAITELVATFALGALALTARRYKRRGAK